jgi:hypothetical protein
MTTDVLPRVFLETSTHDRVQVWICVREGANTLKAPLWRVGDQGRTSIGDWKRYRTINGIPTALGPAELKIDDRLAQEIHDAIEAGVR